MARDFGTIANQWYLHVDSTPITATPFTMVCWIYSSNISNAKTAFMLCDKDDGDSFYCLNVAGATIRIIRVEAGGWRFLNHGTPMSASTWTHIAGVFAADDDAKLYKEGGTPVTQGTSSTPTGWDRIGIGASVDSSPGDYWQDYIAEPALYNAALDDAEIDELAAGYSPKMVRPQNLVFYPPLVRDNDEDIVGGLSLTATGAPTIAAHPRVIYPAPPIFYMKAGVVADVSNPPRIRPMRIWKGIG